MHVDTVANNGSGNKKWKLAFIFAFLVLIVDGADVMFLAFSLGSIKAEFGLSAVQAGMLGSVTLVGMALGGVTGGWSSDRFGRVKTITFCVFVFSILTSLIGFAQDVTQFAILRFISALFLGSVYMVCSTLIAESVPTHKRTTIVASLQTGITVGYIVASVLAGTIIPDFGWRPMFMLASVGVFLAIAMYIMVPESDAWLSAKDSIRKQLATKSKAPKGAFATLFKEPSIRKILVLWILASGFMHFGYYGVNNWMPLYLEQELGMQIKKLTMFMVGSYTAMILGKVIAGILGDKIGRRATFALGTVSTAAFLIIIVMFNSPSNILWLLIAFGFLYGLPFGVYGTYMAESFPTRIRGTSLGVAHNMGRIGSSIGPIAIGFVATNTSVGYGFLMMGAAYLVCVLPVFFIKEHLYDPQGSEEVAAGNADQKVESKSSRQAV